MSSESSRESIDKISGPEIVETANVILFDVDGILVNSGESATTELKDLLVRKFGQQVDRNFYTHQIAKYGQLSEWGLARGLSSEEAGNLERTVWDRVGVLKRSPQIDGAAEMLNWFIDDAKKKVKSHTSRPPELEKITRDLLKSMANGREIKLYIRGKGQEQIRHQFKAFNAVAQAMNYGRVLTLEDLPDHAGNILELADRYHQDVWVGLLPYANIPVPYELLGHPRLICIERRSNDQSIRRGLSYFKGEPI